MKDEPSRPEDLRTRTKKYGLAAVAVFVRLPTGAQGAVMGRQMLRSATSVGAQYREACRARSNAEFISKLESALQELDETGYWLELLTESGTYDHPDARALLAEHLDLDLPVSVCRRLVLRGRQPIQAKMKIVSLEVSENVVKGRTRFDVGVEQLLECLCLRHVLRMRVLRRRGDASNPYQ